MSSSVARLSALSFSGQHIGANLRCLTSLNTAANAEGKQPPKLRNSHTQVLETQIRQYSDIIRFDGITKVTTQKPQDNSTSNTVSVSEKLENARQSSSHSQNGPPLRNLNVSFENSEIRSKDLPTMSQTGENKNLNYPPVATFETTKQTENIQQTQTSFPWENLRFPHHYNYFSPNMTQQTNEPGQNFPEVLQNIAPPTNETFQNAAEPINPNTSFNFSPQSTYPMNFAASYNYSPQSGPMNTFPWENFQSSFDRVFGPNFAKISPGGSVGPNYGNVCNSYYNGAGPQMIGSCTTVSNQPVTYVKSPQGEKPITPLDRLTHGEKPSSGTA